MMTLVILLILLIGFKIRVFLVINKRKEIKEIMKARALEHNSLTINYFSDLYWRQRAFEQIGFWSLIFKFWESTESHYINSACLAKYTLSTVGEY